MLRLTEISFGSYGLGQSNATSRAGVPTIIAERRDRFQGSDSRRPLSRPAPAIKDLVAETEAGYPLGGDEFHVENAPVQE